MEIGDIFISIEKEIIQGAVSGLKITRAKGEISVGGLLQATLQGRVVLEHISRGEEARGGGELTQTALVVPCWP